MQQRKLKIYFTSDVHGYFYPTTYGDMTEKNVGLFGCATGILRRMRSTADLRWR